MNDIILRLKAWAKSVNWIDLALVLGFGLFTFWAARNVGDALMAFAAYLLLRWIVNKAFAARKK